MKTIVCKVVYFLYIVAFQGDSLGIANSQYINGLSVVPNVQMFKIPSVSAMTSSFNVYLFSFSHHFMFEDR